MINRKVLALVLAINTASFALLNTIAYASNKEATNNLSSNNEISAFKEPVNYSFENIVIDSMSGSDIPQVPKETWLDFSFEGRGIDGNPVNMKTVNSNTVYLTDIEGNKVPSILNVQKFDNRGFSIKIVDKYAKVGEIYTLNLTSGITRKKGDSLYPKGYKLSVVTAPKDVDRSLYSSYNNFNLFGYKNIKDDKPLTVEVMLDNDMPITNSLFGNVRIKTSEAVRIDDLNSHVFLVDSKGKKYPMEVINKNVENSVTDRSIDNCEYKLRVILDDNYRFINGLKFEENTSYSILIEKGIKTWIDENKELKQDIKFEFKTYKKFDIAAPIKEIGYKTPNTIYNKIPQDETKLRIIKFLNNSGTKVEAISDLTGEKYIINFVNNSYSPFYIGSTININRYSYFYYFENGKKNINLDEVYYKGNMQKYIEDIRPTYTTITTKKGVAVSALDFDGDIYLIANNQPIDQELLGAKFPIAKYNVLQADFKDTEIDNQKVKGYVGINYNKMNSSNKTILNNVNITYNNLCEVVSGVLYENKDKSVNAPYYIKTKTDKKYYIYHHGKDVAAYTWNSLVNENQFGLNISEMKNNIGKNVIVRGIVRNNTEIVYPTVWAEITANGWDKNVYRYNIDNEIAYMRGKCNHNTLRLDTGNRSFEGFDNLNNFKKYNDGTYATTTFMSCQYGVNLEMSYNKIVMLTDKYTVENVLDIMEKAIRNKKPKNFILKGAMIKNVDGKTILYITDFIDNTNKPIIK